MASHCRRRMKVIIDRVNKTFLKENKDNEYFIKKK
jgi:hypothetical protein